MNEFVHIHEEQSFGEKSLGSDSPSGPLSDEDLAFRSAIVKVWVRRRDEIELATARAKSSNYVQAVFLGASIGAVVGAAVGAGVGFVFHLSALAPFLGAFGTGFLGAVAGTIHAKSLDFDELLRQFSLSESEREALEDLKQSESAVLQKLGSKKIWILQSMANELGQVLDQLEKQSKP